MIICEARMGGFVGIGRLVFLALMVLMILMATNVAAQSASLAPVPPPDFSQISPDDFEDKDYLPPLVWRGDTRGIPFYFYHLHTIANAVKLDEPHRGFIDIVVHRRPRDNQPYNTRVQENHLWLAYFYSRNDSWNIYYAMPEVGLRLEAILEHILTLQNDAGAFSEYGWGNYNLAGTTFAVHFFGQTLRLLHDAKEADPDFPFINESLYNRLIESYRKALVHAFTDESRWNHGRAFTNQYTLLWSAAAAYLKYHEDNEIEQLLTQRYMQSRDEFFSPAGFYYEGNAYDMGYNLAVQIQSYMLDYHYFKDTPLLEEMIDRESVFFEWLSYNLVREPDGSKFIYNAGPTSRTGSGFIYRKDIPLAERLPLARAFVRTQEEAEEHIAAAKEAIQSGTWPRVEPLLQEGGESYNPYALQNRIYNDYYPTEAERAAAVRLLPYMACEWFNHQRIDDRSGWEFTYVRRPTYYAAFNAGNLKSLLQSFGLGMLWHPEGGVMISTQSETETGNPRHVGWGTKKHDETRLYENGKIKPTYVVNGENYEGVAGVRDLPIGDLEISYPLGIYGSKRVVFTETGLTVEIKHGDPFQEHIPIIIKPGHDQLQLSAGRISVTRGKAQMVISYESDRAPNIELKNVFFDDYRMILVVVPGEGQLTYTIEMSTEGEDGDGETLVFNTDDRYCNCIRPCERAKRSGDS